ncbi:MAG: glutamine--fructose-6-phosphate transaminase (isomerizing) [Desulfohalobiaceae bacterium]|nr:glutamine--fructose-6-phosphate transaminase (isomerizing) [Desulfohalobiaceae bacterium]
MCGIIAYTGARPAVPIILDGLKRLEYRGYDSAGIAFPCNGCLEVVKSQGKLSRLEQSLTRWLLDVDARADSGLQPTEQPLTGIGHTRWATHGVPNQENAHPHLDGDNGLAVVHNGIIENYQQLKQHLQAGGVVFRSQTDTEVLAHLIAEGLRQEKTVVKAMGWALAQVEGSFAIAVLNRELPGRIWAARKASPLLLGIGPNEFFLASDVPAFLSSTRDVVYINDNEIVAIEDGDWYVLDMKSLEPKAREVQRIHWNVSDAEKGGYRHFMLKEIFEQPKVIENCLSGRLDHSRGEVMLPEVAGLPIPEKLRVVACGTSFHAGLWAKYVFETLVRLPMEVEIASEFRYRDVVYQKNEVTVAISQSGETADTLAGMEIAAGNGSPVLGLCNVVGSTVARQAEAVLYTQAGPEISVASTKAMCSQMVALLLLALYWGRRRNTISREKAADMVGRLSELPRQIEGCLSGIRSQCFDLARKYKAASSFLYLGRGACYPLALEGALKLKEISYIHAEGYAAGEMKHGPIALVDPEFPTFALALQDRQLSKIVSNLQEVQARNGKIILLTNPGVELEGADRMEIPELDWPFSSFLVLPAIQLFAYETAVALGTDVDQPRNLAKSVTVE